MFPPPELPGREHTGLHPHIFTSASAKKRGRVLRWLSGGWCAPPPPPKTKVGNSRVCVRMRDLALLVLLPGLSLAAVPGQQQAALQASNDDPDAFNAHFFRHTGEPQPRGWRPMLDQLKVADTKPKSIGQIAEEVAADDVMITYIHPLVSTEFEARHSSHKPLPKTSSLPYSRARVDMAKSTNTMTDHGKKKKKDPRKTGISRCGFTWDDAAAKMGPNCSASLDHPIKCFAPPDTFSKGDSYWYGHPYMCYTDLPDLDLHFGNRKCRATGPQSTDSWCNDNCNTVDTQCDPFMCDCEGPEEDHWKYKTPEVFDTSAPIAQHEPNVTLMDLPIKNQAMIDAVVATSVTEPSGLPQCTWRPQQKTTGCSKRKQYECIQGASKGKCSGENWFDKPDQCSATCVHTVALAPAPYYALWYPGPVCKDWQDGERHPRYKHTVAKASLRARGIDLATTDVMMSAICQSTDNQFVGISLYSPHYKDKAERLLRSCARVGVCCKARLLPADAFGASAMEGSEEFRFEVIASKPSFILDELQTNRLPVVFLDTDLEFHSFPHLFVPGSWPNGGRDLAIFNFWGNETDYPHASTPTTGSGVVFFNQTIRATRVLTAWAEAMAWEGNTRAPDDQVLDKILKEGEWLKRASYGWLPASYLRTMPSYYRGVIPVIDHDHGNMPGLLKHSTRKPGLPPVMRFDASDPDRDTPGHITESAPLPRAPKADDQEEEAIAKRLSAVPARKLPSGTCRATNKGLEGHSDVQTVWNNWCDENCIPELWGALGGGSCTSGTETGAVGCLCKSGVKPVGGAEAQSNATTGFRSFHPTSKPSSSMMARIPAGTCGTTNPDLVASETRAWDHWCGSHCNVPEWHAEHCLAPAMSGPGMCVCKKQNGDPRV